MSAKIIDGKAIAAKIREVIKEDVEKLVAAGNPRPGLATVLVGEDPASQTYVRMKQKACDQLGIESFGHVLAAEATQEEVEPIYETLPGWMSPTNNCRTWDDLPANAQRYLKRIEELAGAPIWFVSVGPEREQIVVVRNGS